MSHSRAFLTGMRMLCDKKKEQTTAIDPYGSNERYTKAHRGEQTFIQINQFRNTIDCRQHRHFFPH